MFIFWFLVVFLFVVLIFFSFKFGKPLEGGPARKLPEEKPKEEVAKVVFIGRIPHGFYENEMQGTRDYKL